MATSNTFTDNNNQDTIVSNNTQDNQSTAQTTYIDNTTTTDGNTTGTTDGGTIWQNIVPPSEGGYTNGLSPQEIADSNNITVTISDSDTPIVVLFGSPACGKTTMLIRLTKYLRKVGYKVEPAKDFRPIYDKVHTQMCVDFDKLVDSPTAPESTGLINFMLLKVYKGSKPVCQILEGPGEYYFDPQKPKAQFPSFVNTIMSCNNRKLWAVMVLPVNGSKLDPANKTQYADKIRELKRMLNPRDKFMFVLNKVDLSSVQQNVVSIDYGQAKRDIENQYSGIFAPFQNDHPITRFWKPYNCELEVFHSGKFPVNDNGTKQFNPGNDIYPKRLWDKITKQIL